MDVLDPVNIFLERGQGSYNYIYGEEDIDSEFHGHAFDSLLDDVRGIGALYVATAEEHSDV